MDRITVRQARRLALASAGLLAPELTAMPSKAAGKTRQRRAAHAVVERFGYLQLDTVSIAGARSHALVLMSRIAGFDPELGECLLQEGEPLFEYWGHEASWIPLDLYGAFAFRRKEFRQHPWWGDVVSAHPKVAKDLVKRIRDEGPLRSLDMEGQGSRGWWDIKVAKRVATALWSSGELSIRERSSFQRTFDLTERVIPESHRGKALTKRESLEILLLRALEGHGWATLGTLAATWRLRNCRGDLVAAMERLVARGVVRPCALHGDDGANVAGWIRAEDLELVDRLDRLRPQKDRGVLLSPFDPVLWDRARAFRLFGFEQVLEIFKPAHRREYGYFCMPVLAGERLVARVDLKADRRKGEVRVLSCRYEGDDPKKPASAADGEATRTALQRHGDALGLEVVGYMGCSAER